MPDFNSSPPASEHEPVRLLASDATLSPSLRGLLLSPPPVKPLDAHVAMRVRGAVLQSSAAAASVGNAGRLASSQPMALAKLSAVATGAALLGAGAMTLVSGFFNTPSAQFGSAANRSGVVVVSASQVGRSDADWGGAHGSAATDVNPPGSALADAEKNVVADSADLDRDDLGSRDASNQVRAATGNDSPLSNRRDKERFDGLTAAPESSVEGASAVDALVSVDDLAAADEHLFPSSAGRTATRDVRAWVRPAFRRIASASDSAASSHGRAAGKVPPRAMSSLEEETLLLESARSKLARDPENALSLALEHQSQFRRGQLLEQRRMIHLEALLRLGRDKEALELAKNIGSSLYRARARALLIKYGI